MRIQWLGIRGPGVDRLGYWYGKTRSVLVTGIDRDFAANCPCDVELPPGATIHEMPCDLDGYVFVIFDE